ncbi:MAG: hypothetical protein IJT75_08820 [Bacteroidaceae bacterium]|nr:hypothetical protein [Bacteroidaceae bacterium]
MLFSCISYIKEQTGATADNLSVQGGQTVESLKAFGTYVEALKSYLGARAS